HAQGASWRGRERHLQSLRSTQSANDVRRVLRPAAEPGEVLGQPDGGPFPGLDQGEGTVVARGPSPPDIPWRLVSESGGRALRRADPPRGGIAGIDGILLTPTRSASEEVCFVGSCGQFGTFFRSDRFELTHRKLQIEKWKLKISDCTRGMVLGRT